MRLEVPLRTKRSAAGFAIFNRRGLANRGQERVVMVEDEGTEVGTDVIAVHETGLLRRGLRLLLRDVLALRVMLPAPVGPEGEAVPGASELADEDRGLRPADQGRVGVLHFPLLQEF